MPRAFPFNAPPLATGGGPALPRRSGWFIALGIFLIALGVLAWIDVVSASLASAAILGALLVVAGIVQLAHAFGHGPGHPRHGLLFALLGVFYVLAGLLLFAEPAAGSLLLTAVLAVCLMLAGITRIAWAFGHRGLPGWWLPLLSGLLALLIGITIYATLPWSGLWVPGTLLAIELVFGGIGMLNVGFSLRRLGARSR